ncbi:MAG: dTMP kinase [bacterium]|nr:dTMP kinase [bacterium]
MGPETTVSSRFVVLDGVDGCGKTTQARRLVASLAEGGVREVRHLREPGSTHLGESLRELLLGRGLDLDAGVEALLFAAARRQMLRELVAPALAAGAHVVCERFHASTFAYQAVAGELDPERLLALLHGWSNEPEPNVTVVLDLDVDLSLARRGPASDRIEDKGRAFLERVRAGYLAYAARNERVRVVDASGTEDEIAECVLAEVSRVG